MKRPPSSKKCSEALTHRRTTHGLFWMPARVLRPCKLRSAIPVASSFRSQPRFKLGGQLVSCMHLPGCMHNHITPENLQPACEMLLLPCCTSLRLRCDAQVQGAAAAVISRCRSGAPIRKLWRAASPPLGSIGNTCS